MVRSVSSWFIEQTESYNSNPVRKFYIGDSDYSDYVQRWPSFNRTWDDVRPTNLTINLSNAGKTFNFFISDRLNIVSSCSIKFGYTHSTSGDELVDFYNGMITKVGFDEGITRLTIEDKFKKLSERIMGTQDSPIDYTGSNHLASDLAWYICTSHGNLSAVTGTSNPDIDYESFSEWAAVFSGDNVLLTGRFTGQKCTDSLRRISRITRSAIYIRENKVYFKRFSLVDSLSTVIDDDSLKKVSLDIDDSKMINRQHFLFNYDVTSKYHTGTVTESNTKSVNSYGIKEGIEKDSKVWYVNSQSASNAAQRIILVKGEPFNDVSIKVAAKGIISEIGDMIQLTEDSMDINSQTYRIMTSRYDLNTLECTFEIDASQLNNGFVLDSSSLDGSDILS